MATPPNLAAELLAQLKEARSPLARIRVVTRAWRLLRNLSRQDRLAIAAQIGIDGADDLVEAIATHQGTTPPAELIGALNNLQKVDPATLKSLATKMRDPRQRGKVVAQGLKAVESALIGPETKPAAPLPSPPKPAPAPVTVKPAATWPTREAAPAPAPPAPAPAPVPAPVAVKPAEPPKPAPAPVAAPAPPPPAPVPVPVRPPEPAAPVRSALAEGLAAVPALTARFRLLRRRIAEVRRLSPGDVRAVLEAFPDGWARRRAFVDLIEAGVPERTADILSLMDALQSPGDRSWCLGTLADARALSPSERAALLESAPTAAGRRRLELRLGEI
jgi:hypothetical protein